MAGENRARLGFQEWRQRVDAYIVTGLGIGLDDLPDCPIREWYDNGITARAAANRAIRNVDGEDC